MRTMIATLGLGICALLGTSQPASAQSEPFVGQVMVFGGPYCPANWLATDGRIMDINQAAGLYAVLGTTYGGNGITTFGLPDLRGRAVLGQGTGPDLAPASRGMKGGGVVVTRGDDVITTPTLVMQICIATEGAFPTPP